MINSVLTVPCEECHSTGLVFFGNGNDYHVESCQCEDVQLFNTPENN
jgi:hypothetical protein